MIERLDDVPAGVIGFRLTGTLTRDEYHELLAPVNEALDRGEPLDLLLVLPSEFHGLELGALWEDVKAADSVGLKHRKSWRRTAVVTDKDWVRHGIAAFAWLAPGELKLFEPGELDEAKAWVGES